MCSNLHCVHPHHSAVVRIIKPLQQLHAGALPTAATAHKGQRLAGLYGDIQAIQHLDVWPGGVRELAVHELNVPLEVILETTLIRGEQREHKGHSSACMLWCYLLSSGQD